MELELAGTDESMKELEVVVAGECKVFDKELKRLESPAPAAVMIDGVVGNLGAAAVVVDDAGLGNFLYFFGDGVKADSILC